MTGRVSAPRVAIGFVIILLLSACNVIKVSKGESDPGVLKNAKNLGFDEPAAGDGDPPGWDRRGGEPELYLFEVDPNTKRSGASSALIRLGFEEDAEEGIDTSLIQCVEAEGLEGKSFQLTGWIKTEGAAGPGAALWIGAYDASGEPSGSGWFPADDQWRAGDQDWSVYEAHTPPLAAGVEKICFGPILYGPGSAWFDDLKVSSS